MNLLNDLIDFYDKFHNDQDFWEKAREGSGFSPIAHMTLGRKASAVCITLDREANFVSARRLDLSKDGGDYPVFYPVTIASASRTKCCAAMAHPLCDQLRFIMTEGTPNPDYMARLEDWIQCEKCVSASRILKVIHDYVGKNTIGKDLQTIAKSGISENAFIVWAVILDGECMEVWKEDSIISSYMSYNEIVLKREEQSQCMATGEMDFIPSTYPPVFNCWGNAKLFSACEARSVRQDALFRRGQENLVFIGYHAAEKISSALRWLEKHCADIHDNMVILCWSPDGRVKQSTLSILFGAGTETTAGEWREELKATVNNSFGKASLPQDAPIHILILKRVVSTRISVVYYDRFAAGQFQTNLARWNNNCKAIYPYSKTGVYEVSSPALRPLALHAVGREVNKEFTASEQELDNLYAKLVLDRVKGNPLTDIVVKGIQRNFEKRYTIESNKERIYVEYAAAAVVRKYIADVNGKESTMSLDIESKDVSYQYGRLLAVMERIELDYNRAHGRNRPLMTVRRNPAFVQRPLQVAAELWQKSRTVYLRTCPKAGYYSKSVQEVLDKIADLSDRDKPLKETYILGYAAQMQEFRVKAAKADQNTEKENNHD